NGWRQQQQHLPTTNGPAHRHPVRSFSHMRLLSAGSCTSQPAACHFRKYSTAQDGEPGTSKQTASSKGFGDSLHKIKSNQQEQQRPTSQDRGGVVAALDISTEPTHTVRLSSLPPGTTPADVRYAIATQKFLAKIKALYFEYTSGLRPLRLCRVTFYNVKDAAEFLIHANKMSYAGSVIGASFVKRPFIPNPAKDKYLGHALGRLVLLYGYPQYIHEYQIRDYYSDYLLVDTNIPAVQPAPQVGQTFLSRRGAFILQFTTPSEARRFVRDVHMTSYSRDRDSSGQDTDHANEYCIRALLLN
ncbi:hypothetical protein LPJ57_008389, partial [Coemansia sp. RSA 486]